MYSKTPIQGSTVLLDDHLRAGRRGRIRMRRDDSRTFLIWSKGEVHRNPIKETVTRAVDKVGPELGDNEGRNIKGKKSEQVCRND